MAYRNRPLSRSHDPFKRSARLGPGPSGGELVERGDWECHAAKRKFKDHYLYLCKYVGIDESMRGYTKPITVKKKAKKRRNRRYNEWLAASGQPRFPNVARRRRK